MVQNLQENAKKVQIPRKNVEKGINLHRKTKEENLDVFSAQVILFKHLRKLQFLLQFKLLHQLPHV